MNRKLFISIHLYLSSFFAAAVILVAVSGGLYLLGVKGSVEESQVATVAKSTFALPQNPDRDDVAALLAAAKVSDFEFEYLRVSGKRIFTRPTSETHYVIETGGPALTILRRDPDLQARMIELHKGHGPTAFKTFQQVFALGLVFIILSGLWLGLSAPRLVRRTAISFGAGLILFLGLVFI